MMQQWDPRFCPNGQKHQLVYLGRVSHCYECAMCGGVIYKEDLKAATDRLGQSNTEVAK